MLRKHELRFAQKVVRKGLVPGAKMLESIEELYSAVDRENHSLMDILVKKRYLSLQQAQEIAKELEDTPEHELQAKTSSLQKIGGYQLLEKIGEGGMGVVYKALYTANNRVVALKLLDPELARDQEFIKRFLREARNAAKLKRHDNIVEAYDFGEENGRYYFAMEFVNGRSLAEILYSRGKLEERIALRITKQVTQALFHAHQFSIVHRDIKPENIMISNEGTVKLCDLGLAKDLSEDAYKWGGVTLGTAYYASPEQASGQRDLVDTRSDIYSLGVSLYHMLAGSPPFNDSNIKELAYRHIHEEIPPIQQKVPTISPETERLLKKMTEKNLADRYQNPQELLDDIESILLGQTNTIPLFLTKDKTPPPGTLPPVQKILTKRTFTPEWPSYVYFILLGVVIAVVLLVWLLRFGRT